MLPKALLSSHFLLIVNNLKVMNSLFSDNADCQKKIRNDNQCSHFDLRGAREEWMSFI